jgi:hypothetical protein
LRDWFSGSFDMAVRVLREQILAEELQSAAIVDQHQGSLRRIILKSQS